MSKSIFISYRRDDSSGSAGRLFDMLSRNLKDARIFMDVDGIEPGVDFSHVLDQQLSGCDYFIAVIGPRWLNARGKDESLRLHNENDYVRLEVEAALKRNIPILPVLVDGASMPQREELPAALQELALRNASVISHAKFGQDVRDLSAAISRQIQQHTPPYKLNWQTTLFSFEGRLSRMQYFFWTIITLILTVVLSKMLLSPLGGAIGKHFTLAQYEIFALGTLPITWASLAITAKRAHDFDMGRGIVIILLVLLALTFAAQWFQFSLEEVRDDKSAAQLAKAMEYLGVGLSIVILILQITVGFIPGTPGRNRFGVSPP